MIEDARGRARRTDPGRNPPEPGGGSPGRGERPRFVTMIGLVALVVALVILLFFGIGYALGRLFL